MKPLTERAIEAIVAQLRTILVAADYELDIGLNVYRAKSTFSQKEIPGCAVFETNEVPDAGGVADDNRVFRNTLGVEIVAHVPCSQPDTGEKLGLAKADVKRALMAWAGNLDGSGRGVRDADGQIGALGYLGATALARPDGATSEAVSVRFAITIAEAFGNPYSKDRK